MAATMALSFSMLLSSGLIFGLPLGMPPLERDTQLLGAAPEECLWCMSSAGMARPDPNSLNRTEQLLAEEEIQEFLSSAKTQIIKLARQAADTPESRVLARELPGLVESLLTRPLVAYVADFDLPANPRGPPRIQMGMVVRLGEGAANTEASLAKLMQLAEDGGQPIQREAAGGVEWFVIAGENGWEVRWGRHEEFILLAVGEGEGVKLVERLTSSSRSVPGYLQTADEKLGSKRVSTLGFLNAKRIIAKFAPLLGENESLLGKLGVDKITAIYSGTGMDELACVSRIEVAVDGPPTGILAMLPHDPLSKRDLRSVPHDALAAFTVRLDIDNLIEQIIELASEFDEDARDQFEEAMWEAEREVGIHPRDDIARNLGDVFTLFMPSGDLMTAWLGTTAIIQVKDAEELEDALETLVDRAKQEFTREGEEVRFRSTEYRGHDLHYVQIEDAPFSPSWCVTDDFAAVALSPQSLKSTLIRMTGDPPRETLADKEGLRDALGGPQPPASLVYVDTERLFLGLYPMVQLGAQLLSGELGRQGIDVDLSMLPSAESISMHLTPSYSTCARTDGGFVMSTRQAIPGGDLVSAAPVGVALLLPAVQAAREAARRQQDLNNMKMIMLGMLNYESAFGKYPSDITDKDGNKLLSWRVAILPFIEEQALYDSFHLDEPWDSEHNAPLSKIAVQVFSSPQGQPTPFMTRYLAIAGKNTMMPAGGVKLREVTDGTSNTAVIVLASREAAVEWTKPDDIQFDADNPNRGLWGERGFYLLAFADGSVRVVTNQGVETMRNLFLRNDGNRVRLD